MFIILPQKHLGHGVNSTGNDIEALVRYPNQPFDVLGLCSIFTIRDIFIAKRIREQVNAPNDCGNETCDLDDLRDCCAMTIAVSSVYHTSLILLLERNHAAIAIVCEWRRTHPHPTIPTAPFSQPRS